MMEKLMFYRGQGVGGTWKEKLVHKGISILSRPYTHVELVFSDSTSFSSEYGVGPRFKSIAYTHTDRWTEIQLPHIELQAECRIRHRAKVLNRLREEGYIKYDTRGAFGCTITGRQNPWDYFCSECVYEVLAPEISIPSLNVKMTPQKLFEVIEVIKDLQSI